MNKLVMTSAALLASTAISHAGGIERSGFTTGILFEEGTYVELSYGSISPDVSGNITGVPAIASGNITPNYGLTTLSFHHDINDSLSFSVVIDQPVGANVEYPGMLAPGSYPFGGSYAELESRQITAALRYETANNISIYGGLRAIQVSGDVYVSTPAFAYRLNAESDYELGYMVGAAYERPDIALRVALTYFSEVDLGLSGVEGVGPAGTPDNLVPTAAASFENTLPQSVLLEAQTGIAENTLLFGSIRWTNWDGYSITPGGYPAGSLVSYDSDVWTYTLGVGRRINENWAVSAALGYEAEQDGFSGNLGPTDGYTSISLGAEYSMNNMTISGGVRYLMIGDANTVINPVGPVTSDFYDNDAVAFGLRVGFNF